MIQTAAYGQASTSMDHADLPPSGAPDSKMHQGRNPLDYPLQHPRHPPRGAAHRESVSLCMCTGALKLAAVTKSASIAVILLLRSPVYHM